MKNIVNINQNKILSKIPICLHYLFWRGYFDGDGTLESKKAGVRLSVCSSFDQDWVSLIDLSKQLNIEKYRVDKCVYQKKHKCSKWTLERMNDVLIFLNYIYQNNLNIKLERKYIIYQEIIKKLKNICYSILTAKPRRSKNYFYCNVKFDYQRIYVSSIDIDDFFRKKIDAHYKLNSDYIKLVYSLNISIDDLFLQFKNSIANELG